MVLADYENFFHQFGSLVIAWAALQDSFTNEGSVVPHDDIEVLLLSNTSVKPTALFWSPGLTGGATPPRFVRAAPPPPPATYERLILVQPATETWWWNVWNRDAADRRRVLSPLVSRLTSSLLPPMAAETAQAQAAAHAALASGPRAVGGAGAASLVVIHRPFGSDRRVLNDAALVAALDGAILGGTLGSAGRALRGARLVDLGLLSTRAQLVLIRGTGMLVGAHGAGLLWNLFLPDGAPVLELLNAQNANAYYRNHCLWSRRPYVSWQNNHTAEEQPFRLPSGEAAAPFRNHMQVDVRAIVALARTL